MTANSKIEWTDHTFNPWWGCIKVSPGCEHCYAETFAKRIGQQVWGPASTTPRRMFGDKHWAEPLKWNREAEREGVRRRVFCASMADVFEKNEALTDARARLFKLIEETPWLDWLLLTKRPENVMDLTPHRWQCKACGTNFCGHVGFPANVWMGTTVENQEYADKRIPELLKIPAAVRFLSCEPLLGPVDLSAIYHYCPEHDGPGRGCSYWNCKSARQIDWVIAGGESGHHSRPMHPDWARSLRDQCQAAGLAFHFKQWGQWADATEGSAAANGESRIFLPSGEVLGAGYRNQGMVEGDWKERGAAWMVKRPGKNDSGRELDGRTWDEFPTTRVAVPA